MTDTRTTQPSPTPADGPATLDGERHVSDVAGTKSGMGKNVGVGLMLGAGALAVGAIFLTSAQPNLKPAVAPDLPVATSLRYEAPPAVPTTVPPPLPTDTAPPLPPGFPAQGGQPSAQMAQVATPRPAAKLLVYNSGGGMSGALGGMGGGMSGAAGQGRGGGFAPAGFQQGGPGGAGAGGQDGQDGQEGGDNLGARMQTTQLSGVQANVLRNQPYLLTTGTLVPCVLQTAMESTLPGFVTCIIPQDIQGKTGLTLLDRGTKVVGQFQGGVRQGVERMFVVWTRAETPQGVVVNLDSPASDPLGRSGLSGAVDRHFFQKFGAALLMSVVDGALQAGQAAVSKSGTVTINTGSTAGVIGEVVRGSSNIPPTIRKNQGELVSIFVARDLDFSTVYRVDPAHARYPASGR